MGNTESPVSVGVGSTESPLSVGVRCTGSPVSVGVESTGSPVRVCGKYSLSVQAYRNPVGAGLQEGGRGKVEHALKCAYLHNGLLYGLWRTFMIGREVKGSVYVCMHMLVSVLLVLS